MADTEPKKLFLLDGFALIYRAYFAFIKNPRVNSKGLNTSAAFGFTNLIVDVLKKYKPTHIAVAFDPAEEPTDRIALYELYKAHRDPMPEDIRSNLPFIIKILEAFRIPLLMLEGYEADDVVGTLAKQAEHAGFTTFMMTSDKDYGQLVTDRTFWYKPGRMGAPDEVLGIKEVCEKFGIERPEQVIDLLGLMGDSADNIPGIPGVGEKTAIKFLQEYKSVENLLANTHQLKGKMREKVEENAQLALLSKQLATIITDAPVQLDEEALRVKDPDHDALRAIFQELEFRTLADRILSGNNGSNNGNSSPKPQNINSSAQPDLFSELEPVQENELASQHLKTLQDVPHQYFTVNDPNWQRELAEKLAQSDRICFDTETTGLDPMEAEITGIAFAINPGQAWYIPLPENADEAQEILKIFAPMLENPNIPKIGQNMKYDLHILRRYGIRVQGLAFDTMLAHYVLQPEMRHNMDFLAQTYLQYEPISTESLIGPKGKNQKNMRDVPVEQVAEYCCEDVDVTLQLYQHFEPMLKTVGAEEIFERVEMPLVEVLTDMEQSGICLDKPLLREYSQKLAVEIDEKDRHIQEMAGRPFNTASPKQLGEILFDVLKIDDKAKKTKTGQYATNEETLQKLADRHPIIPAILELRELQKLKSTYVDDLPEMVNPRTGRIHTSYNQAVAATGRLSSNNPNLQNIPIRTERGKIIRKAFIAGGENLHLLCADYSQVELRIIASLAKEEHMIQAFKQGQDIHAATAARVFGVPLEQVDREMRNKAKMVNFGIIYGISAFGLAERLSIPRGEAKEIIESYFRQYPRIRDYMHEQVEFAKSHKYVETLLGRRRYLRDIDSANPTVRGFAERNAINAPIQGTAADIIKLAMIAIHHDLRQSKLKSRMLLQVHDELVFELPEEEIDILEPIVRHHMENTVKMDVPLVVEVKTGKNWLDAH